MTDETEKTGIITTTASETAAPPSRIRKIFSSLGWAWLALAFLVFFTLLKLPEERIRGFVQGNIAAALSAKGINLTAGKSFVSIGFGVSYTMKEVTLSFPPPQAPTHIDSITISPSLLSLLFGKQGGKLRIENRDGSLIANFSGTGLLDGSAAKGSKISGSFEAKNLDLGRLGVLPMLAGVQGSAMLNGTGSIDGDTATPSSLTGVMQLELSKIIVDQQAVMGFSIPRLTISEGKIDLEIDKGKAQVKTFKLGKPGNATDDLVATVTGDATMGKTIESTQVNLKAVFTLSQNVLKSFSLIDMLLGAGKQADGSYAYNLTGPLGGLNFQPAGGGAAAPAAPSGAAAPPAGSALPTGGGAKRAE